MGARIHWLLDQEIDGRVYRWAVERVEVTTQAGEVLAYSAGLGDLELELGVAEAAIEIVDPSVDWPALAAELEAATGTVRRWVEGTALEAAEVYAHGEARGVTHGERPEPVSYVLTESSGAASSLGLSVPDPLARVDETTWPLLGDIGDEGAVYPVIFGFPGYTGAANPVPVVPAPMAQWAGAAASTYVIVSEDPAAPITDVYMRNDTLNAEASQSVVIVSDLLARYVRVATFADDATLKPTDATEQREIFIGYHPDTGGGVARSVYDVLVYLLRRWGPDTVDWSKLPQVQLLLSAYQADTWIDDTVEDPWSYFEAVFLPDLPVEIRTSGVGRYLVERKYRGSLEGVEGVITVGRNARRIGRRSRSVDGPFNEFSAFYRRNASDEWLARLVLTGRDGVTSRPAGVSDPDATTTQEIAVQRSGLCSASLARFGQRQSEDIEVDWTWDTGTIAQILQWRAERDAIPAWLASYDVLDGADLREGAEVQLTDERLSISNKIAIVDAPPAATRSRWASVSLRYTPDT